MQAQSLFGHPALLANRIFTEEYATDSFQNILFPLLLFPAFIDSITEPNSSASPLQRSSMYPAHLTIISHAFKRHRFMNLHLPALRYPTTPERFRYISIGPPMDEVKRAEVEAGELSRGVKAWEQDPYGVGEALAAKRRARGWTVEREQRVWTELIESLNAKRHGDVLCFIDWLHNQHQEGSTYLETFPWS
jgi:hypothetical protein